MFREKKLVAEINELKVRLKLKDGVYDSLKEMFDEEKRKRAYWRDLYFKEHKKRTTPDDNKLNGLIEKLNAAKESVTINIDDPFYDIANQHSAVFEEIGWKSEKYYLFGNPTAEKPDAIVFTKKPHFNELDKIINEIYDIKNKGMQAWWIDVDKHPQSELILNNISEIISSTGVDILRGGEFILNKYHEKGLTGVFRRVPENTILIIVNPALS